jgi:NPCBM/NEW2 domain-containing protein
LPGGGQVEFPWSAARLVDVRSNRVAFLSDLKPIEVDEATLVTLPRPWQRDKSVLGKPLTLGTRVFDKGIGVHARSALTFAAGRKYDVLAAVIGIDEQAGGKGDCVFQVLGDGQILFTQRIKGNDPPQTVNLDISPYDKITLLVEPGEGLDLADHADWCDVRFIRKK